MNPRGSDAFLPFCSICEVQPCSFNGIYQPALIDTFSKGSFLALSYFYDRIRPLFDATTDETTPFTLDTVKTMAQHACQGESHWAKAYKGNPAALKELGEREEYCLDLTFMHALLGLGYEIGSERELIVRRRPRLASCRRLTPREAHLLTPSTPPLLCQVGKQLRDVELGWALGAGLASALPPPLQPAEDRSLTPPASHCSTLQCSTATSSASPERTASFDTFLRTGSRSEWEPQRRPLPDFPPKVQDDLSRSACHLLLAQRGCAAVGIGARVVHRGSSACRASDLFFAVPNKRPRELRTSRTHRIHSLRFEPPRMSAAGCASSSAAISSGLRRREMTRAVSPAVLQSGSPSQQAETHDFQISCVACISS